MAPPGELIMCALLILLEGVSKFALRLTVLPLTPLGALWRGVFGTSPSNLHCVSHLAAHIIPDQHTCHIHLRLLPLGLAAHA